MNHDKASQVLADTERNLNNRPVETLLEKWWQQLVLVKATAADSLCNSLCLVKLLWNLCHPHGKKDVDHKEYTIYDFSQVSDPSREGKLTFWGLFPRNQIAEVMGLIPSGQILFDENYCSFMSFYIYFPVGSDGKASAYNAGDLGSIPGSGRSPGEGHANPLQYSCLENPMDAGIW